jgi:transposase
MLWGVKKKAEIAAKTASDWRTAHGDTTDDEWALIADLVDPNSNPGDIGRPVKVDRRDVVDAIFHITATGCQWRALPDRYPNWNTVHRLHLTWSRDGTWEAIAERLAILVRLRDDRDEEPSAGIIDARSVRAASTVPSNSKSYDAGKKINGRKTFGVVDTLGILIAVLVVGAATSDNVGGMDVIDRAQQRSGRLKKLWCDSGFKNTFVDYCRLHHISAEVVKRINPKGFTNLPKRWIVERTWSWLMNNRRLQVDYERDPIVTEGFIWAAHSRLLLRRLTNPNIS